MQRERSDIIYQCRPDKEDWKLVLVKIINTCDYNYEMVILFTIDNDKSTPWLCY